MNKKNTSIYLTLITLIVLAIGCGSKEPSIDKDSKDGGTNGINGVWTFEKADCYNQDGTTGGESKLIEGATYTLDISDSSILYTFKLGPARNNCIITSKDTITEKKTSSVKIKQIEIKYSPECEGQPEQPNNVEETVDFEIKDKKLLISINADGTFCNGNKSKHYYNKK